MSVSRLRLRWAQIPPPFSARSRQCRIPCLNMPLPGCCAATKPKWSSVSPAIWKCPPARKSCWKAISNREKWRLKARMAITPVTTTKLTTSRYSPLPTSPSVVTPFITRPIPAVRRMSRRCWAWRSMKSSFLSCKSSSRKLSISICRLRVAHIAWQW
ncbi:hypothetical protein D3C81_1638600 [compost metagenome]